MSASPTIRELVYETTPALILVLIGVAGIIASFLVDGMADTYPVAAPEVAGLLSACGWLLVGGSAVLAMVAIARWAIEENEYSPGDSRHGD